MAKLDLFVLEYSIIPPYKNSLKEDSLLSCLKLHIENTVTNNAKNIVNIYYVRRQEWVGNIHSREQNLWICVRILEYCNNEDMFIWGGEI